VRVTFTTVGAELRSVSAAVTDLSGTFLTLHTRLIEEFENPDVWPKHIVVEYLWEQMPDADPESGLVAVLSACMPSPLSVALPWLCSFSQLCTPVHTECCSEQKGVLYLEHIVGASTCICWGAKQRTVLY
jgi:hypothetical protein